MNIVTINNVQFITLNNQGLNCACTSFTLSPILTHYTSLALEAECECTYLIHALLPPPAVASVAGRQLGDIEAGGVRRSSSHTKNTLGDNKMLATAFRRGKEPKERQTEARNADGITGGKRGRQTISRERGWVIEKLSDGWDWSNREMMIAWWMRRRENGEIKRDRWLDEWRQLDCASETLFILFYFVLFSFLQRLVAGSMKTVKLIVMKRLHPLFLIDCCTDTHIHSAASGPSDFNGMIFLVLFRLKPSVELQNKKKCHSYCSFYYNLR